MTPTVESKDDGGADALPVFTRTQGQGHPAAWVGGGTQDGKTFEGVVLCTNLFCLRKPVYVGNGKSERWKQALVGLGGGDVVIYVRGDLPVEPGNDSIEVSACRVKDRQKATSPGGGGVVEVEPLDARRTFFKVLRKHPKVAEGLSSSSRNGRCFVADGAEAPNAEFHEGVVKVLNDEDGYGFVEAENVAEDVFFRVEDVNGTKPQPGNYVRFDLVETVRGPRALNLESTEEGTKERGIVEWFSERKGYGFISLPGETRNDVFVHETNVEGGPLSEGDPVEFLTEVEPRGPRAVDVRRVPG